MALVGHSQIPTELECDGVEIKIFRAPGGKVSTFYNDERMNDVLHWEHDLTILWLGSNDIHPNNRPAHIYEMLREIYDDTEKWCHSKIFVCTVEPRKNPRDTDALTYKRLKNAVNKKIIKYMGSHIIHFCSTPYQEELSEDGVHWNEIGKELVKNKLENAIKAGLNLEGSG